MDDVESWRTVDSVRTALSVVQALQDRGGAGVSEVADALDLAPSTVHAHLKTLEREQFVAQEGEQYHVGLRFFDVGGQAATRRPVYEYAVEKVEKLAEMTGERAQFIVEEHGRGYYLTTASAEQDVPLIAQIGRQRPLHSSAAGKAILAAMPRERVEAIADRWGLPALTEHTITDEEALFAELERVREQGYALNDEETTKGLKAVGAAIEDSDGDVVGAVSLATPSNRMQNRETETDLANQVLGIANEIELNIHHG